jgi:aryl-alcohol dehydrogenase-like predicted oxidoreductase
VRALGASNYTAERLAEALAISEREGLARYEVLQPEHNLMARDKYEGPLQQLCIESGIGVLPYFGLASGFLTGKYRSQEDFAKSVRGGRMPAYLTDKGRRVLAALDEVAAAAGATPAQIALAWLAAQPGITAPIASATSRAQLDELLGVLTLELSGEQIERLSAAGA